MPKDLMNAGSWTHIQRLERAAELILAIKEDVTRSDLEEGVDIVALKGRLTRQADALLMETASMKSRS